MVEVSALSGIASNSIKPEQILYLPAVPTVTNNDAPKKITALNNNGTMDAKPSWRNWGTASGMLIRIFLSVHNFSTRTEIQTTTKPINIP